MDQLREDLGDGPVREVVATFFDRTPATLAELRAAASRNDVEAIRRTAHAVKGTSATLGAKRLADECAELERMTRSGDVPDATARVSAVEASYHAAKAALEAEIKP